MDIQTPTLVSSRFPDSPQDSWRLSWPDLALSLGGLASGRLGAVDGRGEVPRRADPGRGKGVRDMTGAPPIVGLKVYQARNLLDSTTLLLIKNGTSERATIPIDDFENMLRAGIPSRSDSRHGLQ